MTKYRFAVTGGRAVGKTTLARDLYDLCCRRTLGPCALLEGIGEKIKSQGYPLGSSATGETLVAFAAEHLKRERECQFPVAIQDRCLLDLLAYGRTRKGLDPSFAQLLEEIARLSLARITRVFYLPMPDPARVADGPFEDRDFQLDLDAHLRSAAVELGVELEWLRGRREERVEAAFEVMSQIVDGGGR